MAIVLDSWQRCMQIPFSYGSGFDFYGMILNSNGLIFLIYRTVLTIYGLLSLDPIFMVRFCVSTV